MDTPKGRRRTAEEKWQAFLEAAAKDQPTVEVLRRHGLHATDLTRIREAVRRGALVELSRTQGRPKEDPERGPSSGPTPPGTTSNPPRPWPTGSC